MLKMQRIGLKSNIILFSNVFRISHYVPVISLNGESLYIIYKTMIEFSISHNCLFSCKSLEFTFLFGINNFLFQVGSYFIVYLEIISNGKPISPVSISHISIFAFDILCILSGSTKQSFLKRVYLSNLRT